MDLLNTFEAVSGKSGGKMAKKYIFFLFFYTKHLLVDL